MDQLRVAAAADGAYGRVVDPAQMPATDTAHGDRNRQEPEQLPSVGARAKRHRRHHGNAGADQRQQPPNRSASRLEAADLDDEHLRAGAAAQKGAITIGADDMCRHIVRTSPPAFAAPAPVGPSGTDAALRKSPAPFVCFSDAENTERLGYARPTSSTMPCFAAQTYKTPMLEKRCLWYRIIYSLPSA